MVDTYRARYRLDLGGGRWREPGELVPEAHTWFLVEAYLHTGRIVEAQVSEAELRAAIAKFCPELEDRIIEHAGIPAEDVVLEGPHRTPRQRRPKPAEVKLTPLKAEPASKLPARAAVKPTGKVTINKE